MLAINYPVTKTEHLFILGDSSESHVIVNSISNSVILMFGQKVLSRQLEYSTLEEALNAGQAILNLYAEALQC